jgi:dihydrolipoamide dehydrogenase
VETIKTGTLVIGAGPGGYVAAIRLSQMDINTVLVEKENVGGTCLNVGCIPSKALINAAKNFDKANREFARMGIITDKPRLELEKTIAWKDGIVSRLNKGIEALLKGNGVQLCKGEACFQDKNTALLTKTDGSKQLICFENCIISTGSTPAYPPFLQPDGETILDSSQLLSLTKLPARLIIVGGGYIGMELGMVFAKFGTEVTVVEFLDSILSGFDTDVIKPVERKLRQLKIKTMLNSKAVAAQKTAEGVSLMVENAGQKTEISADHIFVSIGRTPCTKSLNLSAAGLKTNEKGFIDSNEKMQTAIENIYAIGDVRSQPMLAHKASKEAEIAAAVIAGHEPEPYGHIPAVIFTDPEIAACGLNEKEALSQYPDCKISNFPFSAVGRSMTTGETDGFIKMICNKNGQILGITIVGPEASDLISEAAIIVEKKMTAKEVAGIIHPHPTFGEIFMECAKAAIGEAVHIINRN